jgi:translocator assembly and maintenance protein 41
MSSIVRYPATVQTLKGVVSGGPVVSVRYSLDKLTKWWTGWKGH